MARKPEVDRRKFLTSVAVAGAASAVASEATGDDRRHATRRPTVGVAPLGRGRGRRIGRACSAPP